VPAERKAPSFGSIAAALRVTTERLAHEITHPHDTAPAWNPFEWDIARAAAAMQGVSVLLANTLRWQGPASWEDFLAEQRQQCAHRDERIGGLLEQIDAVSRSRGIAVVALKGSALREFRMQRTPGERPMGDIDLLVRPHQLDKLGHALISIGYEFLYTSRRHTAFHPATAPLARGFAEHALNPIPIELHTVVAEPLPVNVVDITGSLWPAAPASGVNRYSSNGALLSHLLLHCAGNMRAHALRLSQLRDIAQLVSRMTCEDWNLFVDRNGLRQEYWWIYPPLRLAARYFPDDIPGTILQTARRRCPPLLRRAADGYRLTAVSWSNLRINAFPGIEWSRSPLEALRFAKTRISPGKAALGELDSAQKVMPGLRTIPWYGQRHLTRIIRWLFTRPPRVQTMRSVLDALATGHPESERP
jgi:hypothetical protein